MIGDELSSFKITRGARTYFFDIKKSKTNDLYLLISESVKTAARFEHHRIMIFEEDMTGFIETLKRSVKQYNVMKAKKPVTRDGRLKTATQIAKKSAHTRWTDEEDDKLELHFCEGRSVKQLSELLGRNIGVIHWRIKKLELREKYGSRHN